MHFKKKKNKHFLFYNALTFPNAHMQKHTCSLYKIPSYLIKKKLHYYSVLLKKNPEQICDL